MSYTKMIKWQKTHRKGTRQPVLMSTGSGFWPSGAWLRDCWWPYLERCQANNETPMDCEAFYRQGMTR